jgi:hypothetical protein
MLSDARCKRGIGAVHHKNKHDDKEEDTWDEL